MANFGAEKFWHQFLNTAARFGTDSQIVAQEQSSTVNGGCYCRRAFGWLLLHKGGGGGDSPGDNFDGANFVRGKLRHTSNFGAGP